MVAVIERISRKPSASTTPNENTRLRSQALTPSRRWPLVWKIRFSAFCSWANTAVAPMNSSSVLHSPASEPTLGWLLALCSTVSATLATLLPATEPIWLINVCCAGGYSEAVSHNSSTSSGAIDSRA
ncbi:Uncharacterised protein [Stenotrophomonas maltophilia]|nr:Uncharacterised protein [Stenotrophomonas maltophilia]